MRIEYRHYRIDTLNEIQNMVEERGRRKTAVETRVTKCLLRTMEMRTLTSLARLWNRIRDHVNRMNNDQLAKDGKLNTLRPSGWPPKH